MVSLFLEINEYEVYQFEFHGNFKLFDAPWSWKRSKYEVNKHFPRFPNFQFQVLGKFEIRKPRKLSFFLIKTHLEVIVLFVQSLFFRSLDPGFHMLPKIEVNENFLRFGHGQNRKLGNLENFNLLLLSHIVKL